MKTPPPSLDTLLATVGPIAKHYRLETVVRSGQRSYRFHLWTKDGQRVTASGPTPYEAVAVTMRKRRDGKGKPTKQSPTPIDECEGYNRPVGPTLRLTGATE